MANLNIIFLLKILNQYWTVSSLLPLPPPFDFNFFWTDACEAWQETIEEMKKMADC